MLLAKDARKLVETSKEKVIEEKRIKAREYCENLTPVIEEQAKRQLSSCTCTLDASLRSFVIEELENYGYKIQKQGNGSIIILW